MMMERMSDNEDPEIEEVFSLLNEEIRGGKETLGEALANAVEYGGVGSTPELEQPDAMDGLNTLCDRAESYGNVAPSGFGQFESDDMWYKPINDGDLGQSSLNINEPRVFYENDTPQTISFSLIDPIVESTRRFGGDRLGWMGPLLYSTLRNSVRSQFDLVPDGRTVNFNIPSFKIGNVTFISNPRSSNTEVKIINKRNTYLRFGLPSSQQLKRIPKGSGNLQIPSYFGMWLPPGGNPAPVVIHNGIFTELQLYCDNRASITVIKNVKK